VRTLVSFANNGRQALAEAFAKSEWGTVEQALASLTVFASPFTVKQMKNRPVFRIIRGRSAQRGDINREKHVMIDTDGNHGPITAFCWATRFVYKPGLDLNFNHIYAEADNVELFTNLANICVTPNFLAKITDKHGTRLIRYRAWELFGCLLDREIPPKPAGYDRLDWARPLDPLSDVEGRMRYIMATKPKDSATRSVRELGWVFSSFEPDPTIDRYERNQIDRLSDAVASNPNANRTNTDNVFIGKIMEKHEAIRWVNQHCKSDLLRNKDTHFANINTGPDVWWVDIPIKKVTNPHAEIILNLLLYNYRSRNIHHLRVPTSYFRENLTMRNLWERADKKVIHLELSTNSPSLFQDVKHRSGCRFAQFKCCDITVV
jgi:hypothetical protein